MICTLFISLHAHFAISHHPHTTPSSSHPALPRPTPTSISYLSFHPALFVDKPRGHWPAHMVPMWHFSNSLMARLEAPLYVCNWRLLWRRGLATVAFLFFLTLTPTQTPPLPPALLGLSWFVLFDYPISNPQNPTTTLFLVHTVAGRNRIVCDNAPPHTRTHPNPTRTCITDIVLSGRELPVLAVFTTSSSGHSSWLRVHMHTWWNKKVLQSMCCKGNRWCTELQLDGEDSYRTHSHFI